MTEIKKNKTRKKAEKAEKKVLSPREQRIKNAEAIKSQKAEPKEKDIREDFRKYFVQLKRRTGLGPELENIIWLHLKATGHAKTELFDKGVEHFGYKTQ